MPLVEGETLRSRLEREGRLGAPVVISILYDVVDALAYAHGQGLVHRDIKPENILLQRHHALVTDFGVAKAMTEALPGSGATTAGIAVGTPAYMAPEQLAADPAADHRVDIYAIGLLSYELLSGASPFRGSSPQQTLARQLTERPAPPNLNRTDVPATLSALDHALPREGSGGALELRRGAAPGARRDPDHFRRDARDCADRADSGRAVRLAKRPGDRGGGGARGRGRVGRLQSVGSESRR